MIKQLACIILSLALALGGYGFFIAQRVVGYLYVVPAFFLLLIALILFLIDYLLKKRNTKE
jgi:heme exporter protein D